MYKYTDAEIKKIIDNTTIIVDTREQKNEHIIYYLDKKSIKWCNQKLDYGDYSIKINANEETPFKRDYYLTDFISIERKANLNELSNNLTHNREQFHSEFRRSKGYMYLLIENTVYEDIELHNYNTQFIPKAFRASLSALEHRYNIHVHYQQDTYYSGYWIYNTLITAVRELLKQGRI